MKHKLILGVLASGRGSNLQAIIDAIDAGRLAAKIGVVISDQPGAHALDRARGRDFPAVCIPRENFPDRETFEAAIDRELAVHGVELAVLAGFMRVLSPDFAARYFGRMINIHPALLPAFPGLNAQAQALAHGVKVTGCTVHFVDAGVDSGPIILQEAVPVEEDDTVETLSARILAAEHRLLPRAIQLFAQGRLEIAGRKVKILPETKEGAAHD